MLARHARLAALTLACAALAACGSKQDAPPPEFGGVARAWFGCPSVQGVYAWPPMDGARQAWKTLQPVPVEAREMQIWVQQTDNGRITLRSRRVNRDARVRDTLARDWSYAQYANSEYDCRSGVLQFRGTLGDYEVGKGKPPPKSQPLFQLAKLKDGSLAVAVAVTPGDAPRWRWSKLASAGPGDKEPAPIDASR